MTSRNGSKKNGKILVPCSVCGVEVRRDNMEKHLSTVHPQYEFLPGDESFAPRLKTVVSAEPVLFLWHGDVIRFKPGHELHQTGTYTLSDLTRREVPFERNKWTFYKGQVIEIQKAWHHTLMACVDHLERVPAAAAEGGGLPFRIIMQGGRVSGR